MNPIRPIAEPASLRDLVQAALHIPKGLHSLAWAQPEGRLPRLGRAALVLLAASTITACTVGPDYEAPVPAAPEAFSSQATVEQAADEAIEGPAPDTRWWTALGDATLAELVDEALVHNHDLEIARARVRQARAQRRAAGALGRPQVSGAASGAVFQGSENDPGGGPALARAGLAELDGDIYDVGVQAGWELDVFGGVRRAKEAADARIGAAIEGRRATLLGVVAEVAQTYTELRGAQRRRLLAEKNLGLAEQTLSRVEARHTAGLASGLDLERSRAEVAGTRALVPPLRADEHAAAHRLGTLVGTTPGALRDRLLQTTPWTDPPDLVPVGLPSDLLRRRPDIRLAERQLAASTADIGVRTADLYPRFHLTGSGGLSSGRFADLFESASRTWTFGPSISWPIFQGGRIRAGIEAAEASRDVAYATYQQSVLRALEEVETALVRYAEEELRRRTLVDAAAASAKAADLARTLYDKGLADYLVVLDAERTQTDVEDRLAQSETGVILRLVALYASLGGGWEVTEPQTTVAVERSDAEGSALDDDTLHQG